LNKLTILSLGTVLALGACGGGASAPSAASAARPAAATTAPARTSAPTGAAPAAPTTARKIAIVVKNYQFDTSAIDVKVGETVDFVVDNKDEEKHNMVGLGENVRLTSPDIDMGATITYRWTAPEKAQSFKVICAYHKETNPITMNVK